LKNKKKNH